MNPRPATFILSLLIGRVLAFPSFQPNIPNGVAFNTGGLQATALGHVGGSLPSKDSNQFGVDYQSAGGDWQNGLCQADSDGDTFSNGVELGDPNCTWVSGQTPPLPISSDPTNAASVPRSGEITVPLPPYVIAHGLLMICAWVALVPFGILQATLYKKRESTGHDWYKFHKFSNVAAVVLTLVAFFIQYGLGGGLAGLTATPHATIGIVVVAWSCFHVVAGSLRPPNPTAGENKSTKRLLWEFLHQWIGRCIFVVALAAVYTGMTLGFGDSGATIGIAVLVLAGIGIVGAVYFVIVERDGRIVLPFEQRKDTRTKM